MFGHCALLLATLTPAGCVSATCSASCGDRTGNVAVQVNAAVLPRGRRCGRIQLAPRSHLGHHWLFTRAQRLCRPVFGTSRLAVWPHRGAHAARRGVRGGPRAQWSRSCGSSCVFVVLASCCADPTPQGRAGRAWSRLFRGCSMVDGIRFARRHAMSAVANFLIVW